jgi:hypothetical protein
MKTQKNQYIKVRVTLSEKTQIYDRAQAAGKSASDLMRALALGSFEPPSRLEVRLIQVAAAATAAQAGATLTAHRLYELLLDSSGSSGLLTDCLEKIHQLGASSDQLVSLVDDLARDLISDGVD